MLEHRFNDDLLISNDDRVFAQNEYQKIYHVLDHEELRNAFLLYDHMATAARVKVQRAGLTAVILAVFALLGSALTPLLKQIPAVPQVTFTILFFAEVGGMIGLLMAAGGMAISGQKKTWLEARMLAEVLRLWHFQVLICRGKEIESSCGLSDANGVEAYRAERDTQFHFFLNEWTRTADSHLTDLIESPEGGYKLLHDNRTKYPHGSAIVNEVFDAYKALRFRHQSNYATHKLQKQTSKTFHILSWPSAVLQQRMQAIASFCLIASLLCSLLIVTGHVLGLEIAHHIGWPTAIIALLILNVAARAVQDGLAAPEELQRYNDYAGKIRYLLARFEGSVSPEEKLDLMVEMERAALEELKGFVRAQFEARFII